MRDANVAINMAISEVWVSIHGQTPMIAFSRIMFTPLLALVAMCPWAAAEAPRVVASITPIHSLVSNVMGEIGEPLLLIRGLASPHSYQLRPSDAAALAEADVIVWVGPGLENVLARPLLALAGEAEILTLSQSSDLVRWPVRRGGVMVAGPRSWT